MSGTTRPLRVAYVTMRYPLASETFVTNDVWALTQLGHEVEVHALRASPDDAALVRARGVEHVPVIRAAALRRIGLRAALAAPALASASLRWLIGLHRSETRALAAALWLWPAALGSALVARDRGADVVHLRWGHHPALVGALAVEVHPRAVVSLSLSAYDLEARLPVSRWLAPRADVVRTLARCNVPAIVSGYGRPADAVEVIVNGVPDAILDADLTEPEWGLVVTAGRLIASKGVHRVVRAFARARAARPDGDLRAEPRLEILGDGPERPALERLAGRLGIRQHVTFRGMVPYSEVIATMRRAAVMVFLSSKTSERLPNVIKEALACATAVVSSRTPGITELVRDNETGVLVDHDDEAAIARALVDLLDDPARARGLALAGRDHVRSAFRLSDSARAYERAWREALERRRSTAA